MDRHGLRLLLSCLLLGVWGAACGGGSITPVNRAPTLHGPTVAASEVLAGAAVPLTAEATDPDGDALTYAWTQNPPSPAGTFSDRASPTPSWTAPEVTVETSFMLAVNASDGRGGTVRSSVAVLVRPPPVNQAPVLGTGTPTATPASVVGAGPVQLSVTATDPNGDTLVYSWSQEPASPAGTFSSTTTANPTWTSPVVGANQSFTLKVTVSDGKGGSVQGSASVGVAPPVPENTAPVLTAGPTASPTTIGSQQSVNLTVTASDADGDPLSYAWTQTPTSPAGTFTNTTVANPSWTAPKVTVNTAFTFRVTVSDGKGGTATGSISVNVTAPINRNPTLSQAPQASPSSVTGAAPVQLSVTATDPDGDPLTYAWTQTPASPAGAFSSTSTNNPTWTSPVVSTAQRFTLKVTVTDGQGGSVVGTVDVDVAPPIPQNNNPTLTGPAASPTTLMAQQSTSLTLTAADPDGDPLTYSWIQQPATPAGSFSSTTAANPSWTAPRTAADTVFQLRVTVSDGQGGSATGAAPVTVQAFVNTAPTLTGPSASVTTVNEQLSLTLSSSATDPDGDTLTYAWTQTSPASPMGTFSSASVANPTWTAPDVTANGTYTLSVTVSDGQGGTATGTIDISVLKVNQPPTVAATIIGPNMLVAGYTGTFSITASDPDGDVLTYSWNQTAPATQGTFVGSRTGTSSQWFSPVVSAQTSFTFSVSVTDGQSTPVVRTLSMPVMVPHYSADVQSVFAAPPCTGCHGSSGGLNLNATTSYAALVNNNTNNAACSTLLRVAPGDPDNSTLVRKIEGTTCGTRMPRNNQTFFDSNPGMIIRVRSWILAGAANN
jgi:hypothetical protein